MMFQGVLICCMFFTCLFSNNRLVLLFFPCCFRVVCSSGCPLDTWNLEVHIALRCLYPTEGLGFRLPRSAPWISLDLKQNMLQKTVSFLEMWPIMNFLPPRCNAFDHCNCSRKRPDAFTLVLRRWHSLHESSEFRVFVRDRQLIAISQRQTSGFFEHLLEEEDGQLECHRKQQKKTELIPLPDLFHFASPSFFWINAIFWRVLFLCVQDIVCFAVAVGVFFFFGWIVAGADCHPKRDLNIFRRQGPSSWWFFTWKISMTRKKKLWYLFVLDQLLAAPLIDWLWSPTSRMSDP